QVEFHRTRLLRGSDGSFAVFPVHDCGLRLAATERECVFPLFGQPFRTDVRVPYHQRAEKWVGHFAGRQRDAGETAVTEVRLADEDSVIVLGERTVRS